MLTNIITVNSNKLLINEEPEIYTINNFLTDE